MERWKHSKKIAQGTEEIKYIGNGDINGDGAEETMRTLRMRVNEAQGEDRYDDNNGEVEELLG